MTSQTFLRSALLFVLLFMQLNNVQLSQNSDEHDDTALNKQKNGNIAADFNYVTQKKDKNYSVVLNRLQLEEQCPSAVQCNKLGFPCISCTYNTSCVYGEKMKTTCKAEVDCIGEKEFEKELICRYCYQTEPWEHDCILKADCDSVRSPKHYYRTNCTVRSDMLCLGRRTFLKRLPCNWTGGHRWSTALILSVTLGGFGADRFYLGHWQEGIGKLFSFGGLGVWTLIDVVLIAIHYLGPADGSLYA
ncbi:TM2 domain-containing protein almondex [Nilaparvata lugens]|uniref:TM2 domain-containing protein almondex n=1 Tax=Nilaparvata lugens TaxID=108931 RepID=UPI00193E4B1E|nr:TM2 domain-containing protein almondex [Nilaparvata lugens]